MLELPQSRWICVRLTVRCCKPSIRAVAASHGIDSGIQVSGCHIPLSCIAWPYRLIGVAMSRSIYLVAARTAAGEEFLHETDLAKAGLDDVARAIREGSYEVARITAVYR